MGARGFRLGFGRRPIKTLPLFAALVLAACASDEPPPPCPRAVAVTGAESLIRFAGAGRDLTDVLFEARVQGLALTCEYDDGTVEAALRVDLLAVRGPADRERKATFSYFVAIATHDQEILAREEFELEVAFPGNRTRVAAVEEIDPRIPLKAGETGADYVIYVGLALTPEELRYNLENR